jgi:hypothetical protein
MADGATREFHYNVPRPGMLQAGARSGSLLFIGRSTNGRYVGDDIICHCRTKSEDGIHFQFSMWAVPISGQRTHP